MNQQQARDHFSDRARAAPAISDPGMIGSGGVKAQEVWVVCEENPTLAKSERELFCIRGCEQARVGCRGHVDATIPQPIGDCVINVLIQMKLNRT